MKPLGAIYGGVARFRRSWYDRRPASRIRLPRPVISVGNLVTGGSGKTPVVAAVAAVLCRLGQRPAILSRGYGRSRLAPGIVVVTDGTGPLVPVEQSGDEPQMLARDIRGVPIVVAADRARAGQVAIDRFDSTVLILDDGFQHLRLERKIDLLVLSSADLAEKLLPSGRLREPVSAASAADAVLAYGSAADAEQLARRVGVAHSFCVTPRYLPLLALHGVLPADKRVVAVAGIARPQRFFDALRKQGYDVAREFPFPDHHWFTTADVREIEAKVRELGASAVVTTAKDAMRLERYRSGLTSPWAILPLSVFVEPSAEFEAWLVSRL
ncbi:MAG TPA: tetraacyldisaccharide 4'-kinase [Vicinamibacterales bacterium]|nr:tetraacyldisaccharide 4'-kinase [Vicinamibacterales bacterium]